MYRKEDGFEVAKKLEIFFFVLRAGRGTWGVLRAPKTPVNDTNDTNVKMSTKSTIMQYFP